MNQIALFQTQKNTGISTIDFGKCGQQTELAKYGEYINCGVHAIFNVLMILLNEDPSSYSIENLVDEFRGTLGFAIFKWPETTILEILRIWFEKSKQNLKTKI